MDRVPLRSAPPGSRGVVPDDPEVGKQLATASAAGPILIGPTPQGLLAGAPSKLPEPLHLPPASVFSRVAGARAARFVARVHHCSMVMVGSCRSSPCRLNGQRAR